MIRLGKEKKPYITQRDHPGYPAGTRCLASRPGLNLVLEFEDGNTLELPQHFYAIGLETTCHGEELLLGLMKEAIKKEIDQEVLGDTVLPEEWP